MAKIEIWKDIPNYEGLYQVSNLGNVRSVKRNSQKKPFKNHSGYLRVNLFKNGKGVKHSVHRLVLLGFIGESDLHVNHINAIKDDNRLENLEYVTPKENSRHAMENGLMIGPRGEKSANSKLTEAEAREIKYGHKGKTQREVARLYNIDPSVISNIRLGKSWVDV